jgi:hypothetical protein
LQTARKHLTPAGYALLFSQWNQYKRYTVVQTASQEIYVSLLPSELTKSKAAAEGKHIGQTYFRTRKLQTWIDGSGRECISCSCQYYQRCLIPCHHLLAAKNGVFELHLDIHPQYLQIYATEYGVDLPHLHGGAGMQTAPGPAGFDLANVPIVTEGEVPLDVCAQGLQADDAEEQSVLGGRSMHFEATKIWNELGKHIIGVRSTYTNKEAWTTYTCTRTCT